MKYRLLYQGNERRLSIGTFLVGRSADCAVVLLDPAVSRHHAMIRVTEASVQIEDLGSRNGVMVNGERVAQVTSLEAGDTVDILGHQLRLVGGPGVSGSFTTARARSVAQSEEVFGVLGTLADKALALGQGAEAERILGAQLEHILSELSRGGPSTPSTLDLALSYASQLAASTRRGRWFSYVFKLLRVTGAACPSDVLDNLYASASKAESPDLHEIRDYIASHVMQISRMSPRERFIFSRVQGLERLLSA